ncbi:MAG TPA: zinc ribbon domain-containing protein [Longimicrobium sp.]|nr:zinc ribbon domain-containing protein [Longimicrobium sp.]
MSEIQFSDNYNDLSTDAGFQFEFHCEHCHETWRSPFDRYAAGTAESLLSAAEGVFGGIFGTARNAMGHVRNAGWSKARDKALREASEQAREHFHRCPRCANHHCDNCWNEDEGTCISCVPRLDPELAAISREAKIAKAREVAYESATVSEDDLKQRVVSCPQCGSAVARGKFCPECGGALALAKTCNGCAAEVPASAKFCPECGEKAA